MPKTSTGPDTRADTRPHANSFTDRDGGPDADAGPDTNADRDLGILANADAFSAGGFADAGSDRQTHA